MPGSPVPPAPGSSDNEQVGELGGRAAQEILQIPPELTVNGQRLAVAARDDEEDRLGSYGGDDHGEVLGHVSIHLGHGVCHGGGEEGLPVGVLEVEDPQRSLVLRCQPLPDLLDSVVSPAGHAVSLWSLVRLR